MNIRTATSRLLDVFLLTLVLVACNAADEGGPAPVVRIAAAQTPSATAFQEATAAALPSVVYIQVEARTRQEFLTPGLGQQQATPLLPAGAGSGVLFAEDGYILTNNHVVQQADRVTVTLYDRRQFEAQVVARDPSTDIAVVQIRGDDLPVARLGDSDALSLGQWVLALGSPLGLEFTVTAGIVSATGRAIGILARTRPEAGVEAAPLEDFIQTDAAINPGNSGGPLVDLAGNVVGINSAIASPTGVYAGYGFAVPINLARRVAEQLIRFGEVRRPYLGVSLDNIESVDAIIYQLPSPRGAEVVRVEDGSPAARAGMEVGDVIIALGDLQVNTVSGLQAALAQLDPNTTVPVRVIRYGRELRLDVQLGMVRSGVRPKPPPPPAPNEPGQAGFTVAERGRQVIVSSVRAYSPAARAGVRPGQLILSANRRQVTSAADLVAAIRQAPQGILSLVVHDPNIGRTIVNYRLGS